jgi:hypothetical protein
MIALRRVLLLIFAAGLAGAWLRRRLEPPPPQLPTVPLDPGVAPPEPAEMTVSRGTLPLEDELAMVDAAEPEVDIVDVVDDLIPPS